MSKIKSAETIINESHFLAHSIKIFSRKQVIKLIKTAQRQAAMVALELADEHNTSQIEIGESPNFEDLINSPELEVIDVDWAAKCLYNGLLKEIE